MRFRASLRIAAPAEQVWAVMTDLSREPLWMTAVHTVAFTSASPVGSYAPGAWMRREGRFLGKALVWESELVRLIPGRGATFRHRGAFSGESTWDVEPHDGGCTVTLATEGPDPAGIPLLGRLMAMAGRRGVAKDLDRLKALVESS